MYCVSGVFVRLLLFKATRIVRQVFLLGAVVCFLLSLSLVETFGQQPAPRSYLFVEVKDPAGQTVPDATITVSNADGQQIATSQISNDGMTHVSFPPTSDHHYDVRVTKPGYLPSEHVFLSSLRSKTLIGRFPGSLGDQPQVIVLREPPATDAERLILGAEDQKNQLLLAVKRRDTANLRTLLQLGVNVNTVDGDGVPAIAWAAFSGDVETVKALLAAGADVRNQTASGHLALLIYLAEGLPRVIQTGKRDAAARTGSDTISNDEVVMRLIKAGASLNSQNSHYGTVLNGAIRLIPNTLSEKSIRALVAAGANINSADAGGQTSLMLAAQANSLETVRLLLDAGAAIGPKDKLGRTALMYAQTPVRHPRRYNPEIVKTLIAAGMNVNAVDENGQSALMLAAQADLTDSIKVLLDAGAHINAKDKRGETALIAALYSPYYVSDHSTSHPSSGTLKALLVTGANVEDVNVSNQTPLMLAARINSLDGIKLLLAAGSRVNAKDHRGQTAIMYDSVWSHTPNLAVFKVLIAAKADLNAVDNRGRTPLMFAAHSAPLQIVNVLLEAGGKNSVNAKDHFGQTAVIHAAYGTGSYLTSGDRVAVVKSLIAAGADVNIKDRAGSTALSVARSNRQETLVKFLEELSRP